MNGAQLVYLRDLSDVPPDTQMELRELALVRTTTSLLMLSRAESRCISLFPSR